ncbi:hypothetical protein BDV96DRAFT_487438 [Lophiotrema nucula]|uniref:Uncharacterized protein n=1 Tax=Lophiotrema nucula TaxID=690887 RepID=A0A6A5ZJ32_9PLEO|nr:hypothetical protein BDV96DRAFT_487438 [Lophiotrema nucula]
MEPLRISSTILTVLCLAVVTQAQIPSVWQPLDVVTHFCQRWYHQSIVKDNTLFIHGGIETFNIPGASTNWTNNTLGWNQFMVQVDLNTSWDWKTNISIIALEEKPNPNTGTPIRHGVRGVMFAGPSNDSKVYVYGGTQFRGNESFPSANFDYYEVTFSDQYPLWSLDNSTQVWNQYDIDQKWTPSYGAATEAPDQGLAFYLNGRTDNGTSSPTLHDGDIQTLLDGMVVIDMVQHTSNNASTTGMKDYQPRVGGAMQYVPGVGHNGVLVTLGGNIYDGKATTTSHDKGRLLTFDTVDIFDIASYLKTPKDNGTWYSQPTSGDIPPPRIDFCTIIASAPDNSSHNIYLYGGQDSTGYNGTIFYDDIYVLSLPSFTWINVFQGKSPRYGHTCHLIRERQMLTVGGHNYKNGTCDWEKKSVAILDLPTMTWGSVYRAVDEPYELSDNLFPNLGGTSKGGATKKTPEKGWASPEFGKIMSTKRIYTNAPINSTALALEHQSGLDQKTRTAIIAGVTVAGIVLLACITYTIFTYRRYRLNKAPHELEANHPDSPTQLDTKYKYEMSPNSKKMFEISGKELRSHELPDTRVRVEADRANASPGAVELPATNFSERGRWGVPIIRVPSPCRSGRSSLRRIESGSSTTGRSERSEGSEGMGKEGKEVV